jgi:hypothetical protein
MAVDIGRGNGGYVVIVNDAGVFKAGLSIINGERLQPTLRIFASQIPVRQIRISCMHALKVRKRPLMFEERPI